MNIYCVRNFVGAGYSELPLISFDKQKCIGLADKIANNAAQPEGLRILKSGEDCIEYLLLGTGTEAGEGIACVVEGCEIDKIYGYGL